MTDPSRDPHPAAQGPTAYPPPPTRSIEYIVTTSPPPPSQHGAPASAAFPPPPPPRKTSKAGLLVALAATVAVVIAVTLVAALSGNGTVDDALRAPAASSPSATGKPAAAAKSQLDAATISAAFIAIAMQTKGALLQNVQLNPDGSSRFGVCADEQTITYFAVAQHGATTPDGEEDLACMAGFKTSDLSTTVLADLAAQNSDPTPAGLLIESWATYTPTITILIDDEWGAEYDLAGTELDAPINVLDLSDRKEALTAIEKASGIKEVASVCVDLESGAIMVNGNTESGAIETWQYVNVAQRVDGWPSASGGRLHTSDYDMQAQLTSAQKLSDKYAADGSDLAAVCLDATYDPNAVVAIYFYSQGEDSTEYSHQVTADLDGNILSES